MALASQKRNARGRLFHRKGRGLLETFEQNVYIGSIHAARETSSRFPRTLPRFSVTLRVVISLDRSLQRRERYARTIRCPIAAERNREVEKSLICGLFNGTTQRDASRRKNACFIFTKVANERRNLVKIFARCRVEGARNIDDVKGPRDDKSGARRRYEERKMLIARSTALSLLEKQRCREYSLAGERNASVKVENNAVEVARG